ncbi:MAG: Stk1 family PASTA domain-containing Ser/Thr kinase [Ruminococcus sp.]|nr:Stk1 family PASTA domain-containing Ser/Thr kinase [Ruminococcus sp.]MCM1382487.1 Stk1 family PASTA domain-containing Ser/Thr kinase [Muribaculaceae bacterium]MCM1478547.1 Stk1 family PASTA domain-containing Ser/Thr kinase [Muribaculaceae bacterium]
MDKNIGRKLDGRYEITELIGIGGMADVYKATDILEDRVVAVKILKNEFADNEDFVRRFRNESKAIAVLSHPNIVKIFDVGFTDKIQFIVMEYIDGITLKEFMEQQGMLKWKDSIHFIIQILRALQHAHDRGIVHRDIKPQNIMLFPDGTIKVMDFGIARFAREEGKTISDKAIGSVHYISPEQASGDITDEKSDIYSVGVMMYEMLTGEKPFDGDNPVSVALMHMQNDARPLREVNDSVPEGLEEIVMRAMQKEPSKRYQSASEMIKDIEEFKKNPSIVFEYKYLSEKTQYFSASAVSRAAAEAEYSKSLPMAVNKEAAKPVRTRTKVREELDEYDAYDNYGEDEKPSRSSYFMVVLSAIAAGIIIIVAAFIAIMFYKYISTPDQEVGEMPPLLYYDYQDVKTAFADKFTVVVAEEVYSDYPAGAIIEQSPAEGSEYLVGSTTVRLKISKGQRKVTVPNTYDLSEADAMNMLKENSGFSVLIISEYSEEVPKGNVIITDPPKGESVPAGSEIKVYISRGPEEQEVSVPQCVGYTLEEAEILLNGKFTIQTMTEDSLEPEGTVIEQSIPAVGDDGQPNIVKLNTTIILTLSTGNMPEAEAVITFSVPDGIKGAADFNCYVNGQIIGTTPIDNLAYASTVSITIKGVEMQKVILEAVNRSTKESETIGEYSVDFVENTVTEVKFERSTLKALFTEEEETEPPVTEADPFTEPNDDITMDDDGNIDDDNFWNEIFGY